MATVFSFVPPLLARRLADGRITPGTPLREAVEGAVLFADLVGFSSLAKRLEEAGPAGAEQLSEQLNTVLGALIDSIDAHGGEVLHFAGDAVIALWTAEADQALATQAQRAAACALAAQQLLGEHAGRDGEPLRMRIGIAAGKLDLLHVGGVDGRWELIVGGAPMREVAAAQRLARAGEAVLAPAAASLLGPLVHGEAAGAHLRLHSLDAAAPAPAARTELGGEELAQALRAYLPATLARRIDAARADWLAEFRRVSVLFLAIRDPAGLELSRVDAAARCIQAVLQRYGGSLNQLLVDDKGWVTVAAWGVPGASFEDDAHRAVAAALALREGLAAQDLEPRLGVTTGRVFGGIVGNALRREYALVGDVVNAAAHLMEQAGDGVLCDEATRQGCAGGTFRALAPLQLKGRSGEFAVYHACAEPQRQPRPVHGSGAPLGRAHECEELSALLQRLEQGTGNEPAWLEGEPGIGKSRLLAWLMDTARERGLQVLSSAAESLQAGTAYQAWRAPFMSLYSAATGSEDPALWQAAVRADLEGEPVQSARAPLAAAVLPGVWPQTPESQALRGRARADATRGLLAFLLERRLTAAPTVLVLDDAHWLDSASWALALEARLRLPRLLLIIAARPLPDTAPREAQGLRASCRAPLVLERLDDAALEALLCAQLGADRLDGEVLALIGGRAEGNPFFARELAYSLREGGLLGVEQGLCRLQTAAARTAEVPATVQGVVLSRIDRRPEAQQLTLKVASVIGRVFTLPPLNCIHPLAAAGEQLQGQLQSLSQASLTESDPAPEPTWRFHHAVTREVAYGLLTYSQRRELHHKAAAFYEAPEIAATANAALLAHHWEQAGDRTKTLQYLDKAAHDAVEGGAHLEAAGFLRKLLELDPGEDEHTQRRQGHWQRLLAQSLYALGDLEAAFAHARQALALLGFPLPESRAGWVGALLSQSGRQTLHLLLPRQWLASRRRAPERLEEAAMAALCVAERSFFAADPLALMTGAYLSVNLAERKPGQAPRIARSYAIVGLINGLMGLGGLAGRYFARARQVAEQTGDEGGLGYAYHTESAYWCGVAGWASAEQTGLEALQRAERLADPQQIGLNQTLVGLARFYTGHYHEAAALFATLRGTARARGNRQHEAWGLFAEGQARLRQGEIESALALLEPARALLLGLSDHASEIICNGNLAHARALRGEWALARTAAERVCELVRLSAPSAFSTVDGFLCAGLALLRLHAAAADDAQAAAHADGALAQARWLIRALGRFSRTLTIGRPALALLRAELARLEGRALAARRAGRRALAESRRRGMRYEECLAQLSLARLARSEAERAAALAGALGLAEALGCANLSAAARA